MSTAPKPIVQEKLIVWEDLESSGRGHLAMRRAKVPGGWFVYASDGYHHHGGLTFYPDPKHEWDGCSLPDDSD